MTTRREDPPASFRTLSAESLQVHLVEATPSGETMLLTVRLSYADWRRALDQACFHLDGENEPPGFEPGHDVRLTLRLRDRLAARWAPDTESLAAALREPGSPLLHTEAWSALEILQDVEVPQDMADEVTYLQLGGKTRWAESPALSTETILERFEAFLHAESWPFVRLADDLLRFPAGVDEARSWVVLARLDEEGGTCTLSSLHPTAIPPESRARAAFRLMTLSRELEPGAFDLDPGDGEIRFRTTFAATDRERLAAGVRSGLTTMAASFDDVTALAET